ncbi:RNA 2'-phosphotransferase [Yangia mangrovi]|uniref:RNA 2'-phosphotransferase n=1 Tax=Alloyangia mangrovi TaxID=1779329 RepID=A0A2A3JX86_9RHOB|nr:RNA 2'-phosphotransferase [Alloyangia mangrovi]
MSKQSKFLSRILRHEPGLVGLTLATSGWVHVDDLLRGMRKVGQRLTLVELRQIVAENDKQRFTLSKDGRRAGSGLRKVTASR